MENEQEPQVQKPEKIAGGRGKETLFRVSARNQIELIAIADNKANMITGVNVILISLIIAAFGSGSIQGFTIQSNLAVILPFSILFFFCFASAILAIIAAKPVIIKTPGAKGLSLLFFNNFYQKSLDQYLKEMHTLLNSRKRVYDQLIIDMYHNGLVLKQKYYQLGVAYTLFLIGLVGSVVVFVVFMLIGN